MIESLKGENEALQKNIDRYKELKEKEQEANKTKEVAKQLTTNEKAELERLTKSYKEDTGKISENNKAISSLNKSYKTQIKTAEELVARHLQIKDGYEKLQTAVQQYQEAEGDSAKEGAAVSGMQTAVAEMTGADVSHFDSGFILENIDAVIAAAEEGGEALTNLQMIAAKKIIIDADIHGVHEIPQAVADMLTAAQQIANDGTIEAYATLDNS